VAYEDVNGMTNLPQVLNLREVMDTALIMKTALFQKVRADFFFRKYWDN
jgi:hypothetical protein